MVINFGIVCAVAVLDRVIGLIACNFSKSRLHMYNRAPIVHDSDTWLPNIPRSIVKFRKNPAILTTVLCVIFLIASELITELGVSVSETCEPKTKSGAIVTAGSVSQNHTTVELGAMSFFVQAISFLDGNLTFVSSGMPKELTGRECLPCLSKRNPTFIAKNCNVRMRKVYSAGELLVGVHSTSSDMRTMSMGFRETDGNQRNFSGKGYLTSNGKQQAIFLVQESTRNVSTPNLLYLEYAPLEHAKRLKVKSGKTDRAIWERTESQVYVWSVSCEVNQLSSSEFQEALAEYRAIQLENPARLMSFDERKQTFERIYPDDIYRAIFSIRVVEDDYNIGEYQVYTTCAVYKWEFMCPFILCLILITVLGCFSLVSTSKLAGTNIPYGSRAWFLLYIRELKTPRNNRLASTNKPTRTGYFDSVQEGMCLAHDGNCTRISFHLEPDGHSEDELAT